jgi:hypothetical protein
MSSTGSWTAAVAGSAAAAQQYNNLLGLHTADLHYTGSSSVSNTGTAAGSVTTLSTYLTQPFVLSATSITSVQLYGFGSGVGADVTISIQGNNGGNPDGTAVATTILPSEFQSGTRYVSLPLAASGLSSGGTYHLVLNIAGSASDYFNVQTEGSDTPYLRTSANGTVWSAGTTQFLFSVNSGAAGTLLAFSEDSTATTMPRYAELIYTSGTVTGLYEYTGTFRNTKTLTYSGGTLESIG